MQRAADGTGDVEPLGVSEIAESPHGWSRDGVQQVYVSPFPSGSKRWQVSAEGGCKPVWSRDGRELYHGQDDTLIAVRLTLDPEFRAVSTTTLFSDPRLRVGGTASYDVSSDGRFIMLDSVDTGATERLPIHVIENWHEEFRDRE